MGTLVTIQVVRCAAEAAIERAFAWFHEIEAHCTRFDPRSELMQLTAHIGESMPASDILYESVRLALMVAEESDGAFDPTVTGLRDGDVTFRDVSFRDIKLDEDRRTITLLRPLTLDLGAVAKGLAVDMAARELQPFTDFAIDAGGDLYLGGCNPHGDPWSVGIRHPRPDDRMDGQLIDSLRVSNTAVCTSGDYERKSGNGTGHHILDPRTFINGRTGASAGAAASVTVLAPTAMLADALATAAFVLGPAEGIPFLERLGVEGLLITPELERHETRGLRDVIHHHAA
jgi:thiamine biosynthesis lipoprotein